MAREKGSRNMKPACRGFCTVSLLLSGLFLFCLPTLTSKLQIILDDCLVGILIHIIRRH